MSSDNSDNVVRITDSVHRASGSQAKSDQEVCQFCFGTGTRLEIGPDGAQRAAICECRRTNGPTRLLDAARIPPRFRECSFHNYYPKNDSQYFAHSFASRLVEEYPAVESGLLFMGSVGVGKTHLAIAVLKELIDKKGVNSLFYESGALLKATRILTPYRNSERVCSLRLPGRVAWFVTVSECADKLVRDTLLQNHQHVYNNELRLPRILGRDSCGTNKI